MVAVTVSSSSGTPTGNVSLSVDGGSAITKALSSGSATFSSSDIGALATPDQVRFAVALPKTRSGKIMRRLLRDIAAGRESTQDTTTLEDLSILAKLRSDED